MQHIGQLEFLDVGRRQQMSKCKNCGHDSHCGGPLWKDVNNSWEKRLGQIEVCKMCRCEKCEVKTDWG